MFLSAYSVTIRKKARTKRHGAGVSLYTGSRKKPVFKSAHRRPCAAVYSVRWRLYLSSLSDPRSFPGFLGNMPERRRKATAPAARIITAAKRAMLDSSPVRGDPETFTVSGEAGVTFRRLLPVSVFSFSFFTVVVFSYSFSFSVTLVFSVSRGFSGSSGLPGSSGFSGFSGSSGFSGLPGFSGSSGSFRSTVCAGSSRSLCSATSCSSSGSGPPPVPGAWSSGESSV